MSIKKDIMNALSMENAIVNINEISFLVRYQKSFLREDVDELRLEFKYVIGVKGGARYRIISRTYNEILDEIDQYTRDYLANCANEAVKNLRNGYR